MSGPKTTWEDLANLGWPKQQVYTRLNAQREGTMDGLGDMALNEGFALDWSWYSYNAVRSDPRSSGNAIDTVNSQETVWSYDNSGNLQPFTTTVTEKWTESAEASLSITNKASITLGSSVSIAGVGGSSFEISIGTESTQTETKKSEYSLEQTWTITVGANEVVKLNRTKTTTSGNAIYYVDYGISNNSLIATKGDKYNGHYYWGYNVNYYLDNPKGTMSLTGKSSKTSFTFKIERTGANGRAIDVEDLPLPTAYVDLETKEVHHMTVHADPPAAEN